MNRLNNFKVCLFRADHPADLGQSTTLAIFKMTSSKLRRKAFRDFKSPRPQKGDISESPVCFTRPFAWCVCCSMFPHPRKCLPSTADSVFSASGFSAATCCTSSHFCHPILYLTEKMNSIHTPTHSQRELRAGNVARNLRQEP